MNRRVSRKKFLLGKKAPKKLNNGKFHAYGTTLARERGRESVPKKGKKAKERGCPGFDSGCLINRGQLGG